MSGLDLDIDYDETSERETEETTDIYDYSEKYSKDYYELIREQLGRIGI